MTRRDNVEAAMSPLALAAVFLFEFAAGLNQELLSDLANRDRSFRDTRTLVFVADDTDVPSPSLREEEQDIPRMNLVTTTGSKRAFGSIPCDSRMIVVGLKKESSMDRALQLLPLKELSPDTRIFFVTDFSPMAFDLSYDSPLDKFWHLSFSHLVSANSSTYAFW